MADKVKLILAALILMGSVGAFYYFGDQSLLLRVVGLLAALSLATVVAVSTERGAGVMAFGRGAIVEVRKVVWPTRKETVQTTLIVIVMVIIVGLILWMFDTFLGWAVQLFTGQGS